MTFLQEVADQLNLRWAWEKVRREATPGDIWFDEIELAAFDLELEQNLQSIAAEFATGTYKVAPLRPLPFPKHPSADGKPRIRQAFNLKIRDQVAWTAVVNVVGPHVDNEMPPWSYGNRLYRPIWIDEESDGRRRRKTGQYRHSSGQLFLSFGQSWPVFRRHVYLATRAMTAHKELPELDERTEEEAELQKSDSDHQWCQFVQKDYWQHRRPKNDNVNLYWCGIDLEKFYPSVNIDVARANIVASLPNYWAREADTLLDSLFVFPLDLHGWDRDQLRRMDITDIDIDSKQFRHIPTGLYTAGFLANAALLKVDLQIRDRLKEHPISHFRFVDDHIILAYSLDELRAWVLTYAQLLKDAGTGALINPSKTEPKELGQFLASVEQPADKNDETLRESRNAAEKACRLDPQFPSPLMTKTLSLVSSIARVDFNLLDSSELAAMSDQLEHLLLVDLSEEEIPAKTRLSFAATRLTLIATTRIANDESRAMHRCQQENPYNELQKLNESKQKSEHDLSVAETLRKELTFLEEQIRGDEKRLNAEMLRAFQLLRKVLRERPDRIRLWTRAIQMCRHTGVFGINLLIRDVSEMLNEGRIDILAADYLHANILTLISTQCLIAGQVLVDDDVPAWKKQAAKAFLNDVCNATFKKPTPKESHFFYLRSWEQYCFGIYCTTVLLKTACGDANSGAFITLPKDAYEIGRSILNTEDRRYTTAAWAWWAARMTLRNLKPNANNLVIELGKNLPPSRSTTAYWSFFPLEVPDHILKNMIATQMQVKSQMPSSGWWFDVLRARHARGDALLMIENMPTAGIASRVLYKEFRDTLSLYEWCTFLRQFTPDQRTDPRFGEWTALQITGQIAELIGGDESLTDGYIAKLKAKRPFFPHLHPANFRVPKAWCLTVSGEPTWAEWQSLVNRGNDSDKITYIPKSKRIEDRRYAPFSVSNSKLLSSNPVRGLGLLLYGLLRKSFDLPAIWNGPGHCDVLGMLPKLLLSEMTCSSWTLGILQGCLQPRAMENLFLKRNAATLSQWHVDDDTVKDPIIFLDAGDVLDAIKISQKVLVSYQLSTLGQRARQLTPINVMQLTDPDWNKILVQRQTMCAV